MSREAKATPNLLPCPFCGGDAFIWPASKHGILVTCDDDDCAASDVHCFPDEWNTRVSATPARIARLEEALLQSARIVHQNHHPIGEVEVARVAFEDCDWYSCKAARVALQSEEE